MYLITCFSCSHVRTVIITTIKSCRTVCKIHYLYNISLARLVLCLSIAPTQINMRSNKAISMRYVLHFKKLVIKTSANTREYLLKYSLLTTVSILCLFLHYQLLISHLKLIIKTIISDRYLKFTIQHLHTKYRVNLS